MTNTTPILTKLSFELEDKIYRMIESKISKTCGSVRSLTCDRSKITSIAMKVINGSDYIINNCILKERATMGQEDALEQEINSELITYLHDLVHKEPNITDQFRIIGAKTNIVWVSDVDKRVLHAYVRFVIARCIQTILKLNYCSCTRGL